MLQLGSNLPSSSDLVNKKGQESFDLFKWNGRVFLFAVVLDVLVCLSNVHDRASRASWGVSGGRGGGGRCLEWRRPMTPHPTPKSAAAATTATLSAAINQILGVNTNTPKASGLRFVPTAERLHKDPPPSPTTRILPLSPTEPTGTKPSKPKRIPIVNPNPSRVKTLGLDWL